MSMRHYITLMEDGSPSSGDDWLSDDPKLIAKLVWRSHDTPRQGDPPVDFAATITARQEKLKRLLGPHGITIHRGVYVGYHWEAALDGGETLGLCWSYDPKTAIPYAIDQPRGTHLVRLTALAPASSVNWAATLAMVDDGENEIRLLDNAPISLLNIAQVGGRMTVIEDNIRSDLYGQTFKA